MRIAECSSVMKLDVASGPAVSADRNDPAECRSLTLEGMNGGRWTGAGGPARLAAIGFTLIAGGLLLSALLTTFAILWGAPEALRLPFRLFCHGIGSHCLHIAGVAMPLCARCTAIYGGMIAGVGIGLLLSSRSLRFPLVGLVLGWIPLSLDGLTQAAGLRESTNALRVATGLLFGVVSMIWVMSRIAPASPEGGASGSPSDSGTFTSS